MNISILTPDQEIFEGEIRAVFVPGIAGRFEVMKNHAPLVAALDKGSVKVDKADGGNMSFTISKGFIEVLNNEVALLVQGVEGLE